ncbi:hypothetical protein [Streptococcus dysgalactiae]|uniref:hypothetical protein n=1 Tax=Streptococcus dysgalactiae TaxID=1334 RepID=UPI0021B0D8E2|nr:hypothetical protein [Streptococcus dysgalactiae]
MRKLDLTGKTFNRLTVIKEVPNSKKDTYWLCRCSCGKFVEIKGTAIKNGTTKSCGCLALEIAQNLAKKTESQKMRIMDITKNVLMALLLFD